MTQSPNDPTPLGSRRAALRLGIATLLGASAVAALTELRDPGRAIAAGWCECVVYLRNAGLINGGPCWAKDYKSASGYVHSRKPRKGWMMVIQSGILGTSSTVDGYWLTDSIYCDGSRGAGHIAQVAAILKTPTEGSPNWKLQVRHANWGGEPLYSANGCSNVSDHVFVVPQKYLTNGWVTFIKRA